MRTFRDAKAMAKTLRQGLSDRNIDLSHSDCLELVARQFGLADWNTLAAKIDRKSVESPLRLPEGWSISGSQAEHYDMGIDENEAGGAALIRCKYAADDSTFSNKANGFATLMQSFLADAYLGRRIMLRAKLKTEDVDGAATMWMRIDGVRKDSLRFDNMETRATDGVLRGTTGWAERRIVLDVPKEAESIHFGFYLRGTGSAWARGFDLSEVGDDVAATAGSRPERSKPVNLDFSRPLPRTP
jgi:Glyoxalase superfamily protein